VGSRVQLSRRRISADKLQPVRSEENSDAPEPTKPLSFREVMVILVSGHIGVRKHAQRAEDFRRANGLHLFIAAIIYFSIIVFGIVMLVRYVAS
jgi:hypothetical protein